MFMENNGRHDRGGSVFVGATVTFALATVFVIGRIVSRFCILKHRQWDDYAIIVAWVLAFGMTLTVDFSASKGLGRQETDIEASDGAALLASEYAAFVLYNPALMATKTSILIFYIRISKNTRVFLRWASSITLAVVIVAALVLTPITIFRCRPVRAAYVAGIEGARCLSIEAIFLGSAPVNIATDLAVVILPIPVLTSMTLPRRQKCILVLTFMVGASVTVVDVVRIYYLQLAAASLDGRGSDQIPTGSGASSLKFSYNASLSLLLSAMEVNVGIICACVPVLRPLIKRMFLGKMLQGAPHPHHHHHRHHQNRRGNDACVVRKRRKASQTASGTGTSAVLEDPPRNSEERRLRATSQEGHEMQIMNQARTRTRTQTTQTQTQTAQTAQTRADMIDSLGSSSNSNQVPGSSGHSTFINATPRSLLNLRDSESLKYCVMVTSVYCIWGFAYALLYFSGEIPITSNPTPVQSQGIICASYTGRIVGPIIAVLVLRTAGFKATLITGLGIYCVGNLMFWPSGSLRSYPGFLFASFVTGLGIAVFMAATYGFLTLCGPPHHAEFRTCLATGVKSTGTIAGGIISQKILINNVVRTGSLVSVQWTYLASALSTAILGLLFHCMPIPEATDEELQTHLEQLRLRTGTRPQTVYFGRFGVPVLFITLFMAVVAIMFHNGAWSCADVSIGFKDLVTTVGHSSISLTNYFLVAQSLYAAGQYLFAFLSLFVPGHVLLLLAYMTSVTFAALTTVSWPSVNVNLSTRLVLSVFEAAAFPLIFAIGTRGLGRWTKPGVCFITSASGIGPCAFPFIMLSVLQAHGIRYAYCVVAAIFSGALTFPLYLLLFRPARDDFNAVTILSARLDDNSTTVDGGATATA